MLSSGTLKVLSAPTLFYTISKSHSSRVLSPSRKEARTGWEFFDAEDNAFDKKL